MPNKSSFESAKNHYSRRGYYLKPENRFWEHHENNHRYSEKTKEYFNKLAESFYNRKHIHNEP